MLKGKRFLIRLFISLNILTTQLNAKGSIDDYSILKHEDTSYVDLASGFCGKPFIAISKDPKREQHILIEIRALSLLHASPFVLGLYDTVKWNGRLAMVTAFMAGGDLHETMNDEQFELWPTTLKKSVLIQVAAALEYAHSQDVCHLDVKPENVFLTESDMSEMENVEIKAKLGDWGTARTAVNSKTFSKQNARGTIHYMAPDQFGFKSSNCKLMDVWSFGILVHYVLYWQLPIAVVEASWLKIMRRSSIEAIFHVQKHISENVLR